SVVNNLADTWNANVIRAAMGVENGGYLTSPATEKQKVQTVVDAATAKGIYVIIDWHAHDIHTSEAVSFFGEMAQLYKDYDNVIFEVYNEPDYESWAQVKQYALQVIQAIRSKGANQLIVVGTPTWSQDVDVAANDPITGYSNIAYTLHFYAGTHKQFLRDKAVTAMNKGLALFVTEWGTCDASGNGGLDLTESQTWINFMDQYKLSWCNWSLNDKAETASALVPGASTTGPWPDSQLTESGKFVKAKILLNGTTGSSSSSISSSSSSIISSSSSISSSVASQTPYNGVISLPGLIEAENFDNGGQNIAFYDTTAGNSGNAYRNTDVDIESTTDTGGGYNVGWIANGEWLEYTVNVTQAGTYNIEVRVASINTGRTLRIEFNGVDKTGTLTVPNTGGWQNWQTITKTGVSLSAGQQIMRIYCMGDGFNINWVRVVAASTSSSSTSSVSSSSSSSSVVSSSSSSSSLSSVSSSSSSSSVAYVDVTAPFSFDGAGTKYWRMTTIPNYINSWNLDSLVINGVELKNVWVGAANLPAKQNGYYYITYKGSYAWSHFEAK
ncbi:MAG: cellulase family glycosylhydrolase, partial [Brevinematales bacterium]|nr:cellulase family glycosylhydrolase [Brevinematales bacterium]